MNKDQKLLAEVYTKVYGEAHDINSGNFTGKEWHGLGEKDPAPKITFDPKFKGSFEEKDKAEFLAAELAEDIKSVLGTADTEAFAKAVAEVFNNEYSNELNRESFIKLLEELISLK